MRRLITARLLPIVCGFLLFQPPSGVRAVSLAPLQDEETISFGHVRRGTIPAAAPGDCVLGSTQYVFDVEEGDCEPVGFGLSLSLFNLNDQEMKLYARLGQRVAIEDGKVLAEIFSAPSSNAEILQIDFGTSPPLKAGRYYFAVSNCGSEAADYQLNFGGSIIDFFSPFALITRVEINGDDLLLYGCFPKKPAKLFMDGDLKGNITHDELRPRGIVISGKADKIDPGETVNLQLKFRNGIRSNKFRFTRPQE